MFLNSEMQLEHLEQACQTHVQGWATNEVATLCIGHSLTDINGNQKILIANLLTYLLFTGQLCHLYLNFTVEHILYI